MAEDSLNLKRQKFIDFYIESGNASDAVVRAGYTTKYPERYAYQLLQIPKIKSILEKTRQSINSHSNLSIKYKLDMLYEGIEYYRSRSQYVKCSKLCEVANKMQGHNAPEKISGTINVANEMNDVIELTEKYTNEYIAARH
jgi:phage terminase small subunit